MDIISKSDTTTSNIHDTELTESATKEENETSILKSIVIQDPSQVSSNTGYESSSSTTTTTTTTSSLFSHSTTNIKSKRNSDGYDPKELKLLDLETSSTNKRNSLQLPSNYSGTSSFMRSPLDSPSKGLARNLSLSLINSVKKSRPSSAQFSTSSSSSSSSSSINSSSNKLQESQFTSVPPSPHYTVRRNKDISFPSATPSKPQQQQEQDLLDQQQQFQQSIQYRHNNSYEEHSQVEHLLQNILDNPNGKISKDELNSMLYDLFPYSNQEYINEVLDKIPFDEYGYVPNNEMISLMQQQNLTDDMDELLDDHPINNLTYYENGKNSLSIINPSTVSSLNNNSSNLISSSTSTSTSTSSLNQHQFIQPNTKPSPFGQYSIAVDSGDFEGIGTNGVHRSEEYQILQDEIIQLKKEIQIYKDNESSEGDIKGKYKKLEEENQKLYIEIKRLDEEGNRLKKELGTLNNIDKKRKDLLTEVEEYKKNEIELKKKNEEYKKQISTLKNLNKEEKQKLIEAEKIKEESLSKSLELDNKLKAQHNRYNQLQQQYETVCLNYSKFEEEEAQRKIEEEEKQKKLLLQQQQQQQNEIQSSRSITNIEHNSSGNQNILNSSLTSNELFKQSQLFDQKNFSISSDQHHKELIKKIETLESENLNLQSQYKKLEDNCNKIISGEIELKTTISSLETLNSQLKQQLDNASKICNNCNNNQQNNNCSSSSNNNNNITNEEKLKYNQIMEHNKSLKSILYSKNDEIKNLQDSLDERMSALNSISNGTTNLYDGIGNSFKNSNADKNVKQQQEQLNNIDNIEGEDDFNSGYSSTNISFSRKLFNKLESLFAIFGLVVFVLFSIAFISRLNQNNLLIERPN